MIEMTSIQAAKTISHNMRHYLQLCLLLLVYINITNCSSVTSSVGEGLADNLSTAIQEQDDPKTVKDGAPAYLLMIDSLIAGDPESVSLLSAGANLYSSYASVFVDDPLRAKRMAAKAWGFAVRAMCSEHKSACELHKRTFDEYAAYIQTLNDLNDAPLLYTYGTTWASYIQINADDWNAIANLSKVVVTMEQVQKLDDTHDNGGVHLYLGVLASLIPPALGGKPEVARMHFERAIELSKGQNLMAKVIFAEKYARMTFNRELHDGILENVVKADPHKPGMTLMNTLAQARAKTLLKSADEYF